MSEEARDEPGGGGAIRAAGRGLSLVWQTSHPLTVLLLTATLVAGTMPVLAAYVARIVVDAVVAATQGVEGAQTEALWAILAEGVLVSLLVASQRALTYGQELLKVRLAHAVTSRVLDKAITLGLEDFEDPSLHDRMEEVRREATARPLNLVLRTLALIRASVGLIGYVILLAQLSPVALVVVALAGFPSFIAELRFSEAAFRFFRRHSPENRERQYIETLLTREEFAKEVGFFGAGPRLIARYGELFDRLYAEDRRLVRKRHLWGLGLGVIGNAAFFGAYLWIVLETIGGRLTLGEMTMYIVVFRQAQAAVAAALAALGGIYEDTLYLDGLDALLAHPTRLVHGDATEGPDPSDGLRVEGVSWTYPGAERPALDDVSFHLPPGRTLAVVGANGSGKSTLVKLLTRRYLPQRGRVLLEGLELGRWGDDALRARVSVLFQDFNRYKLTVGENIGAGDASRFHDEERWARAADAALATSVVEELPDGFHTRLGRAFRGATELSGGQWQRLAFARALMREDTALLIFDEPTSSADPRRQAELDDHLREILAGRMGLVVSHRLATARLADEILVLDHGRVRERGSHEALLARRGLYAELFEEQAERYR